ncbi:hypothetical protein NLI96_g4284 [Meripilus lineatus]|uniref:Uncharacterized protein n=1 Tax=Meripilus lineatus TaxID=2056292 RepID=A0AAD5YFU6_9APHY|nr:hypothetical protein NLI96_g4284 [Physisporinus lineatus]
MPEKSGFRPRPKAFTGARKPFNVAEAQADADSGWSRRKPEDESSQTSPTKSRSAYENVKDKVRDFFKRGPAPSSDSEREARNRQVADELFPPEEPVAIRGRRERVIEFDINSPFELMVLDTQPIYYDAVMDDNASVFSWSSAETLVNDVRMHDDDDTSDLDYILHYNSPKAQEDCGQDSLCGLFVSQLIIKSEETSGDASLMDMGEDSDELVDVTMRSLPGDNETFLSDGDISMEILVSTPAPGSLSGSSNISEQTSVSTILEANVDFCSPGWATPHGVIRTAKPSSRSSLAAPYSRRNSVAYPRKLRNPLAGLKDFINGGPSRGSKGRLVTKFSTLTITPVTIVVPLQSAPPLPQSEPGSIPPAAPTVTDACNNSDDPDDEPMLSSLPDEAPLPVDNTNTAVDSFLSSIDLGDNSCDLPDFEDVETYYASAAGRSEKTKEDKKHVSYTPYTRPPTSARIKDATVPRRAKNVRFGEDSIGSEAQRLEELANQIASLNVAEEEDTNEEPSLESNIPVSDREALLFIIDALEDVQQFN